MTSGALAIARLQGVCMNASNHPSPLLSIAPKLGKTSVYNDPFIWRCGVFPPRPSNNMRLLISLLRERITQLILILDNILSPKSISHNPLRDLRGDWGGNPFITCLRDRRYNLCIRNYMRFHVRLGFLKVRCLYFGGGELY